ncbi:MAG: AEC family transporter [Verrucomicrobia bacterium]|nr:AEC family transporter [Verrucomicrobiota bacterium]
MSGYEAFPFFNMLAAFSFNLPDETGKVLLAVLPVFCIAMIGIFMRKVNWLTEQADQSLLKITINVLSPALIFDSILNNDALKQFSNVIIPPLVGFGTVAMGIGVGWIFARFAKFQDRKTIATVAVCAGIYNWGYIPVPLVTTLFDRETLGVLFVHNVGVELCFWTLAVGILGGKSGRGWKQFINPPVIAIILSLTLNAFGGHDIVPTFILISAKMLGQCAIPLGIILVGAMTADHLKEFHSSAGYKTIVVSCILRLGILPIFFLLLAKYLPCSLELKRVIIIQGAMPTATFTVILARHYGGDASTAVRAVIATSALSLITIPLWIRAGLKFVGL